MKPTFTLFFVVGVFGCSIATAVDLTFLTPDDKPAGGVTFYRTFLDPGQVTGVDMMMGGYGAMGMDEGMEEEYGMDMGMGMGGSRSGMSATLAVDHVAFLNRKPLQPMIPPVGEEWSSTDDGKIEITGEMLKRSRGVSTHATSALAVDDSGISFIPAGMKFSPTVKLRSGGKIIVTPPEGVDVSQYQVLTCWQNGFAYPNLQQYRREMGPSEEIGKQLDPEDWRFSPRFRWYQSADLGDVISVPPGEIRVTIVPLQPGGRGLAALDADQLFELLTSGGPSTIVLVSGKSSLPTTVEFAALRSLNLRVPKKSDDALPNWGDQPPSRYQLQRFNRESFGDTPMLTKPSAQDVASRSTMVNFLNQKREERASYQEKRLPSSIDDRTIRFELLRPGWYVVNKFNDDGVETPGIPITNWQHGAGITTAVLADGKIEGVDGAFQLAVSDQGVATFRSSHASQNLADQATQTQRSDAEKLKLVHTLRSEIEATMVRMMQHRKRLLELEAKLLQQTAPADPMVDPFGGPEAMEDPYGGRSSGSRVDPFADPFGGGGGTPNADPFGGSGGGADPFGADPFGGNPNAVDPFGGGGFQ